MKYNFDMDVKRRDMPSEKWNPKRLKDTFGRDDLLPLWVADMDFEAPSELIEDLTKRINRKTFGYEYKDNRFYDSFIEWNKRRHNIHIDKDNIYGAPSVLTAISILVDILTEEDEKVLYQPPVYYPFLKIIKNNKRTPVKNPLKLLDGKYEIDFKDLEEKAKGPSVKLLIIASPHNPVGRVWSKEELERILDICMKNNVFVISDEIHRDILLEGRKFTSISELSEEALNKVVTLLSPGKTFNISSLTTAVVLIKNKEVAERYLNFTERYHINVNNALSNVAFKSVYAKGEEWFEEFLRYLEGNIEYTKKYLEKYIPQARLTEMEGSYLAWIDLRYLNMDAKKLAKRFLDDGKVAFDFGHWFGREGAGFIRINLACTRDILKEALSRTHSVTSKIENSI